MQTIQIDQIKKRLMKLDSAAISDAMDSLHIPAGLAGIVPRSNVGIKMAGPAFTVRYEPIIPEQGKFLNAGNYIDEVPAGYVIVVDNQGRTDCTSWGNILTFKAVQKGIAGSVIYGSARDLSEVRRLEYPLFTTGVYMVSGKNRAKVAAKQCTLDIGGVAISPGDWVFADDNGALVIPQQHLLTVIERAENVDKTEQAIIEAITNGEDLVNAREKLGYAVPWKAAQ
ncbi:MULTISPECIES: RraA family protein [Photorhabdus]|uniref:RraA family protein n=1 Tax=Photorhabdus TaxID=29487 RepID=UPI000DCB51B4|nr:MULTISPECIES: RraA family protein [Photorhabdus]MCT8342703.1 RraA family protein [Photorhabdus kleinii]RAW97120.1 S-adenosylmethionine--2-demethylmenaquinone methyltransferase [Photorhabdus sp. S10-54]RAW97175.1 S-adenosylmethionine--2-demethylmenaquinone methyltransferase [Photorhabdus sp. S9-53]RAX01682.1 S-adenosylmethionine--2-demethylmenaquinone methyltransferase [Photorhabdus sp. S8-52]